MKPFYLILIVPLLMLCYQSGAQRFERSHLDSFFQIMSVSGRAMGTITLSKGGNALYQKSVGAERFIGKQEVPATFRTKYRIGSITKMFTATMVFQAIEERKLSLTTPLASFFKEVPRAAEINIGQLLGHRSGIHNITDDSTYSSYMTRATTRKQLLQIITAGGSEFAPDSTASYSNSNYILLGFIMEDIYKKPYSKLLQEHICTKAGLTETAWGSNPPAADEAKSYFWENKWTDEPVTHTSVPGGAGAIVGTTADLNRFLYALFTGKLVSAQSLKQMMTMREGYGMGMFSYPFGSKRLYGHTGGIDGFQSIALFNPEDSLTLSYCTNGVRYARNDVLLAALSSYYGVPMPLPTFTDQVYYPQSLDQYPGTYASTQIPLKITIVKDGSTLSAQATGQSALALTPIAKDEFGFEAAGIVISFQPEKGQLTLKQGGGAYLFNKEK